jgi:hypothetical protein
VGLSVINVRNWFNLWFCIFLAEGRSCAASAAVWTEGGMEACSEALSAPS